MSGLLMISCAIDSSLISAISVTKALSHSGMLVTGEITLTEEGWKLHKCLKDLVEVCQMFKTGIRCLGFCHSDYCVEGVRWGKEGDACQGSEARFLNSQIHRTGVCMQIKQVSGGGAEGPSYGKCCNVLNFLQLSESTN